MTQAPAPATTIATAVRQHGGGRHPLNLQCTAPAGRLQDSRGGVINRRAEGATSSNTLPASCAAAAHPTTGVRRARELSPSLRSQSCQPAQLVEGYKASRSNQITKKWIDLHQLLQILLKGIAGAREQTKQRAISLYISSNLQDTDKHRQVESEPRSYSQPSCALVIVEITGSALHDAIEEVHIAHPYPQPFIAGQSRSVLRLDTGLNIGPKRLCFTERAVLVNKLLSRAECFPYCRVEPHALCMITGTVISLPHQNRNSYRHNNGQNRANSLHPGWGVLTAPWHDQHQNDEWNPKERTQEKSPNRSKREADMDFLVEHASLPARVVPQSLPALCHHVQRGAA